MRILINIQISKNMWMPCSVNIIRPTLGKLHGSYVWRVRIFLYEVNSYCVNLCLAEMHVPGQKCTELIEMTARALSGDVVALMLEAVQKDNLELSINYAINQ
jgi:hypothetical protein